MAVLGRIAWIYSGQQWAKAGMTTGNKWVFRVGAAGHKPKVGQGHFRFSDTTCSKLPQTFSRAPGWA
jgi:hypothetical protein